MGGDRALEGLFTDACGRGEQLALQGSLPAAFLEIAKFLEDVERVLIAELGFPKDALDAWHTELTRLLPERPVPASSLQQLRIAWSYRSTEAHANLSALTCADFRLLKQTVHQDLLRLQALLDDIYRKPSRPQHAFDDALFATQQRSSRFRLAESLHTVIRGEPTDKLQAAAEDLLREHGAVLRAIDLSKTPPVGQLRVFLRRLATHGAQTTLLATAAKRLATHFPSLGPELLRLVDAELARESARGPERLNVFRVVFADGADENTVELRSAALVAFPSTRFERREKMSVPVSRIAAEIYVAWNSVHRESGFASEAGRVLLQIELPACHALLDVESQGHRALNSFFLGVVVVPSRSAVIGETLTGMLAHPGLGTKSLLIDEDATVADIHYRMQGKNYLFCGATLGAPNSEGVSPVVAAFDGGFPFACVHRRDSAGAHLEELFRDEQELPFDVFLARLRECRHRCQQGSPWAVLWDDAYYAGLEFQSV